MDGCPAQGLSTAVGLWTTRLMSALSVVQLSRASPGMEAPNSFILWNVGLLPMGLFQKQKLAAADKPHCPQGHKQHQHSPSKLSEADPLTLLQRPYTLPQGPVHPTCSSCMPYASEADPLS